MRSKSGWAALALILALAISQSAPAIPVPALNLTELVRDADLIVVGQVTNVQERGRTVIEGQGQRIPARRAAAVLRVDRVVKGRFAATSVAVNFLIPETFLGYAGLAPSQFGMFFLRRKEGSDYGLVSPYYPFLVASAAAPAAAGNDLNRVIAEIAQVLLARGSSGEERQHAVEILAGVKSPPALEALRAAAQDPDASVRLKAAATLLRQDDISTLSSIQDLLLNPPENMETGHVRDLALAIKDGVKNQEAVPVLTRLLQSRDVTVRRAAAAGLRHTEADTAVGPLSMALDDTDREVRYQAVLGLAALTGQEEWGPAIGEFERDEQRYLVYWREWAKNNK